MSHSVLLVNSWRVIGAKGGTEKVFCDLANALNDRGFSVTLLCCDSKIGKPGFKLEEGVRFVNVGRCLGIWEKLFNKLKTISLCSLDRKRKRGLLKISALSRSYREVSWLFEESDVVISFQPETTYILKEELGVKVPIVSMFHHDPKFYFTDPLFYLYRDSLLQCKVLQVLRPEFVRKLLDIGAERVVCIPNVCPRFEWQKDLSRKKIVFVGRVNLKQKRLDLLVRAFSRIKKDFPGWTVEIWGEEGLNSHDTKYIIDLIGRLNLTDCVFLKGVTDNVESVLRDSSIFAFPSAYEGFGLALIEAMMVGIPAVGCVDCSAVNTLIQNGVNGILTRPDPASFSVGLSDLMRDKEKRLEYGEQARKTAQRFDPDAIWNTWENLLNDVLNEMKTLDDSEMEM